MPKPELLAPAGSLDCLKAAINSGADAVYFAGKSFGARAFARNFSMDELKQGSDYCHLFGAKAYVTVNTLLKNHEFQEALSYIAKLYEIGIDAVIVQDFGLATAIKDNFPDLDIHASTQTSLHNSPSITAARVFDRFILARELSLDEVKAIIHNTKKEVEVFIHGALCISYSGQCLMSSFMGGRSANRGRCAQPCRLPYAEKDPFRLSPADLCSLPYLSDVLSTGVSALKIEGRMKPPAYVSEVVSVYRKYIDLYKGGPLDVEKSDIKRLEQAFNRSFTKGFLGNAQTIVSPQSSTGKTISNPALPTRRIRLDISVNKDRILAVAGKGRCEQRIEGRGRIIDNRTAERVFADSTIFEPHVSGTMSENQLAAKPLIVRSLLGTLAHRRNRVIPKLPYLYRQAQPTQPIKPVLYARAYNMRDARIALDNGADYAFLNIFAADWDKSDIMQKTDIMPEAPAILHDSRLEQARSLIDSPKSLLTGNPAFAGHKGAILDYSFNIFNDYSLQYWQKPAVISPELSIRDLQQFNNKNFIVFAHGNLVLMRTKEQIQGPLIDRLGRHIPLRLNPAGYTEVLNPFPHGLYNEIHSLMAFGIRGFLIDIDSNARQVVQAYRRILDGERISDRKLRAGHTTGRLYSRNE